METKFPLKDHILYRIYQNKSIIELEVFENFKDDLNTLARLGYIKAKKLGDDSCQYPYDLIITITGVHYLFRES